MSHQLIVEYEQQGILGIRHKCTGVVHRCFRGDFVSVIARRDDGRVSPILSSVL